MRIFIFLHRFFAYYFGNKLGMRIPHHVYIAVFAFDTINVPGLCLICILWDIVLSYSVGCDVCVSRLFLFSLVIYSRSSYR
ncbi:hypothetical protein V1507DRAFT_39244 [Lipomyces tetrasporus]